MFALLALVFSSPDNDLSYLEPDNDLSYLEPLMGI